MPITRDKKEKIVGELTDAFKKSSSVVFVSIKGIKVNESNAIRDDLAKEQVECKIAKKTLISIALENSKIEGDRPALDGEVAVAYGEDLIAPARSVKDSSKKAESGMRILGGVFEGRYMSEVEMNEIANIPPISVLYSRLLMIWKSPMSGIASALDQVAKQK